MKLDFVVLAWLEKNPRRVKMLSTLVGANSYGAFQASGYGRAPLLSICRALAARGLAGTHRTGVYYATKQGEEAHVALCHNFASRRVGDWEKKAHNG
jgi:hypothetical protein